MSGPNDRAIWLTLRSVTPWLPVHARILDVEPSQYTRRWFDRFNQFDYRTMSRTAPDVEIAGDLASATITKGICHLILCAAGIDRDEDLMATVLSLYRLTGDDGIVVVGAANHAAGDASANLRHALEEAGFVVSVNDLAQRVTPEVARRYGLALSEPILIGAPNRSTAGMRAGHHSHTHA